LPKLAQEKQLLLIASLQLIDTSSSSIQALVLFYKGEAADFRNLEDFAKYLPEVSIAATCGGIPIKPQMNVWPPTSVATPGRLIDLIQRKVINLKETNFCLRRSR
jgi:ATP-dependent RNA helicase DeaD